MLPGMGSSGSNRSRGLKASGKALPSFAVALALSALCFQVLPADTLAESVLQSAALAAIAGGSVAFGKPTAFRCVRVTRTSLGGWAPFVLGVGMVAGAALWWLAGFRPADVSLSGATVVRVVLVLSSCLMVGVFEEGVFRVLALEAFAPRLGALRVAVASAILFGMLHASFGEAEALGGAVAWTQAILKPLQAGLFGFFMAAWYLKGCGLWGLVGVHAVFDLVYLGPLMLMTGGQPAYVTGSPADLAILAGTTVLLLAPACAAWKAVRNAPGSNGSQT